MNGFGGFLTPKEFRYSFGFPKLSRFLSPGNFVQFIEPNDDRYLIWLTHSNGVLTFAPGQPNVAANAFIQVNQGEIFEINHVLHGSLVNVGWYNFGAAGATEILLIEGIMVRQPQRLAAEQSRSAESREFNGNPSKDLLPDSDTRRRNNRRRPQP